MTYTPSFPPFAPSLTPLLSGGGVVSAPQLLLLLPSFQVVVSCRPLGSSAPGSPVLQLQIEATSALFDTRDRYPRNPCNIIVAPLQRTPPEALGRLCEGCVYVSAPWCNVSDCASRRLHVIACRVGARVDSFARTNKSKKNQPLLTSLPPQGYDLCGLHVQATDRTGQHYPCPASAPHV
jgi:hypothetical protein